MRELMGYLPDNYPDSRETVTFQQALQPEVDYLWAARNGLLAQLNPYSASWGLYLWEDALGLGPRLSRATLPRYNHRPPAGQFCVTPLLGVRRSTITLSWAAGGGRDGHSAPPNDRPMAAHEGG